MKRVIELLLTKRAINKLWLYNFKVELLSVSRSHALFISIVLFYLAACLVIARIFGVTEKVSLFLYYTNVCILGFWCFLIFFIGHFCYVRFFVKPDNVKEFVLNDLQSNYLSTERLCHLLLMGLLIPAFLSAFTSFKIILPAVHPFSWDSELVKIDSFIHGGSQPWQWLQTVLAHPIVTFIISIFYNAWFFVMYAVLFWQAFSLRDKQLRMQFFLTYALLWIIIGSAAAAIFSSAGPCYYSFLAGGDNTYRPLMEYLRSVRESFPVWSLDLQDLLWSAYNGRETGLVKGISAMPSMHVSIAFLFVLLGWRVNRIAGIGFTVFLVIIMIGSVHLGWHYAIDGYAAAILTYLIWQTAGFLVKRSVLT